MVDREGFIEPTIKHLEAAGWTFPPDAKERILKAMEGVKAGTLGELLALQAAIEAEGKNPHG